MKLGVNMFIWTPAFGPADLDLLPRIKAAGFDGIEFPIFDPQTFPAQQVRAALRDEGLECTVCSVMPGDGSLLSELDQHRARGRAHLEGCIEQAAEAGAKILAGPLYSPVGYLTGRRRTHDEWARAIETYASLAAALEEHDITLAIEPLNRFETYFLNTASDAVRLCKAAAVPRIGILYDTFHANIEEKNISESLAASAGYVKHVHTCENDRGTPGSGHVDWSGVFQTLGKIEYDGWLTIESFGFAIGGISAAASIWRDLEASAEAIAFQGIQFLQSQIALKPSA